MRPLNHHLTERYEQVATKWHATVLGLGYQQGYRDFIAHADPVSRIKSAAGQTTVIDVGAGTAAFSLALVEHFGTDFRPDLLDSSQAMLGVAMENLRRVGVQATAIHANFDFVANSDARHGTAAVARAFDPLGKYDLILCAHLIEHLPDPLDSLAGVKRLLLPGRLLLLVVSQPHWCSALVWLKWRHRVFGKSAVLDALQHAGFSRSESFHFKNGPPRRTSIAYMAWA
jgi:ubiquinone/menaquinone biosynthesis C-methylase UbiE